MRVDTDRDQAVRTRRNFLERYCDTDTLCCTMHFPSPSVGHIKRWATASAWNTQKSEDAEPPKAPSSIQQLAWSGLSKLENISGDTPSMT